jgi:hypothetical protein
MAASDPAREPMLERAHPGDVLDGSTIPEDTQAEILLRDGTWAWCRVIGQRKDRHGRWCVGIRWYPNATFGESGGWYIYEPGFIRRINFDDLGHLVLAKLAAPIRAVPLRALRPRLDARRRSTATSTATRATTTGAQVEMSSPHD